MPFLLNHFGCLGSNRKNMTGMAGANDTNYRSFWSILSPAFLNPSAVFVAAFFNFRSIFSPICFSSIFFAALENPCSILLPTFLAVPSIRSTTLRSLVGSLSANAAEPEAKQIGRNSQMARRICRCNCIAYIQPHEKHTTNRLAVPIVRRLPVDCLANGSNCLHCHNTKGARYSSMKIRHTAQKARSIGNLKPITHPYATTYQFRSNLQASG